MALLVKFTNSKPNSTYVTSKGVHVNFVGNQALVPETDKETIAELKAEVDAGHPFISYDVNDLTVDEAVLGDPLFLVKQKWLEEMQAEQESNQGKDTTGDATPAAAKPASTADLIAKAQSNTSK